MRDRGAELTEGAADTSSHTYLWACGHSVEGRIVIFSCSLSFSQSRLNERITQLH